ncbi:MAG: toll/interleukin-1 receptor domain-containing protein [Hyphomicrobiales bacterium]
MNPIYQISAFGHTKHFTKEINEALSKQLGEFGLSVGNEVVIDLNGSITSKNPKISAVGLFFGNDSKLAYTRPPALSDYDPIIPIVSSLERCSIELPTNVSAYNAMPSGGPNSPTRIAAAAIEALGLMPSRRRVFLSYRRNEARKAALQLFDELSERQFDVFLDTHEIRPGAVFQDVLWHHLSDCDVMLMLDTTSYF